MARTWASGSDDVLRTAMPAMTTGQRYPRCRHEQRPVSLREFLDLHDTYDVVTARIASSESRDKDFLRTLNHRMHSLACAFSGSILLPASRLFAMFDWNRNSRRNDASAQLAALHKSQAVIEFELDGTIIAANENFLRAMGYSLTEGAGKHPRMFFDASESNSAGYRDFWAKLGRGEFQVAEFKRLAKGDREIWIEASYNPVLGRDGKPYKVVKFATDVTAQKINALESAGKVLAIGRS